MNMLSDTKIRALLDRLFTLLEEGKLYWYIQLFVIVCIVVSVVLSGIDFTATQADIKIKESKQAKRYHIRKVSRIPEEKQKEEAKKLAVEDDTKLSRADLKNRYYNYVVTKIERNKVYPLAEQKKGHEGSVVMRIFINRTGKIEKVQLLRRARYIKLTKAAINAIKRAHPFKPYSKRIAEDYLILRLSINFFLK